MMRGFALVGLLALSAHLKKAKKITANTTGTKPTIQTAGRPVLKILQCRDGQYYPVILDSMPFLCSACKVARAAATVNVTQGNGANHRESRDRLGSGFPPKKGS
jgi:hypothetical protein